MSLDQLLRATLPSKIEESKPVSPTLLIGLGGTGKEILLRLRRLIVERWGSLDDLPFIQFVHMDTDCTATAKEQYDFKGADDPLHDEVKLKPAERIDLTIEGGTGKYIQHINTYPHIKRWLPTSGKIAGLGNLGEGAGQIRMASRLGFFHAPNYSKIAARLEQVRGSLQDPAILNKVGKLGFEFDAQGMTIFVICSLAGGTGGGTFLDMGFLLQRYFPAAERVGILMLPSFFRDYAGGRRVRANGYAALVELNYYSFGHTFLAGWDPNHPEVLPPPPFSTTYLIDGTNEANLVIGSSGKEYDAYQMISEILFQDYSVGKFAGMKRATRVNLVNFNLNVYTHNFLNEALKDRDQGDTRTVVGDTYPTRFGSFGLATIGFPNDRVHSACGARLAAGILEFWQKSLLEDPLERLFTSFLNQSDVSFAQGRFERRDGGGVVEGSDIEDALSVYEAGGGKTFQSFFWEKAHSIRNDVEAAPVREKALVLEGHLAELEKFLAREDSDDPEEWGVGIRQLEGNMRNYLERVKDGIEKRAEKTANDSRLGVAYTLSLLRELKSLLRNENFSYLPHFEPSIAVWRDEIQSYSHQLDQLKLDIGRHERQFLFRTDDLNRDMEKLVAEEGSEEPGVLYSYLYSRVMKQVAKRGKRVCEEIDDFLGKDDVTGKGLLGRYYKLLAGFERLKDRLHAKARYFAKAQRSELLVSLYREEDTDTWYRTWIGELDRERTTLNTVGNQMLKKIFNVDSVTAALAHIQRTPVEEIEARMLAACKSYFSSQEDQPEALEILFGTERFSQQQREEMIRRAYNLGKVWLARAELGLEHTGLPPVASDQRPCLIGVDTSNIPRLEEFKTLVREIQQPGDSPPSFLNIGGANNGTIIFYNELAGVPAFYPRAVTMPNGLRSSYDNSEEKQELHIDKNRFQFGDLIPKTEEKAQVYANSLKAFVLARLLGLLKVRQFRDDSNVPTFHYSYKRKVSLSEEDVPLGDELNAVDALFRDTRDEHLTDRRLLLGQVDDTINRLRAERQLWVYGLLIEFYLYQVYPPTRDDTWMKDITITQYSPDYAVLALARTQVEKMLPNKEERQQLENALAARRRGKQGENMTYHEFMDAFGDTVREAGKFAVVGESTVGVEKVDYLPVPALDAAKVFKIEPKTYAPPPKKKAKVKPPEPTDVPQRPCPLCGKSIDARAVVCRHCKDRVAEHVTCPSCGQEKVPDDLESCWECGALMKEGEKIICPQCYSSEGYRDNFKCEVCGYTLSVEGAVATGKAAPEEVTLEEEVATVTVPPEPATEQEPAAAESPPAGVAPAELPPLHAVPAPEVPETELESVEEETAEEASKTKCPTCFEMVEPGPECPVCGGLLESR